MEGDQDRKRDSRRLWEEAAPGWAAWEAVIDRAMGEATELMFDMAGIEAGARVLDLACGAGSQTLRAARRVGAGGQLVAADIAETMLERLRDSATAAGIANVSTMLGAAEDLDVAGAGFDAVCCRLGLMLFVDPAGALRIARAALRPGGRMAAIVFTTPANNPFMARPMQILLRHAGKQPPAPGQPGLFALGAPGGLERMMRDAGFAGIEQKTLSARIEMASAAETLAMMQAAFGAYRAVVADCPEAVRAAAWAEVADLLRTFEGAGGLVGPAEVLVCAGRASG